MGRPKKQQKGKEESSEGVLNEIERSKLSDIMFKTMVIRKLNELSANYQKLQGSQEELIANCISIKKDTETINKGQEEMKNTISELKSTVEGTKTRMDEAEDGISKMDDKVEKNSPKEIGKENERLKKNDDRLRGLQDIIVTQYNNIHIIGI